MTFSAAAAGETETVSTIAASNALRFHMSSLTPGWRFPSGQPYPPASSPQGHRLTMLERGSVKGARSMKNGLVRLTEPMVRANGGLRTATWEEALDRAASGLQAAVDANPGWGVGLFSCSKATNE